MKKQGNKNKNEIISILAFLCLVLFLFSGCGAGGSGGGGSSGGGGGDSYTTSVSVNLNVPSASKSSASSALFSTAAVGSSGAVSSIAIEISGPDMGTINDTFGVSPGTTVSKTYDVPTGTGRTISVRAYSGSGDLLYEGEVTIDLSGTPVTVDLAMVLSDISEAIKLLNAGDIVGAHDLFRAAAEKYNGAGTNDEDIAHFFYALTRIGTLWFDIYSDGEDDGLNDSGDILDAFGCENTGRDPVNMEAGYIDLRCPQVALPLGHPTGPDLRNFSDFVIDEITAAISSLDKVSTDFQFTWTEPFDSTLVESDYGDAIILKGVLKGVIAMYKVNSAYSPNIDVADILEDNTIESFLNLNPGFPVMSGTPSDSVLWQGAALADIREAVEWIRDFDDNDQTDDWIGMDALDIAEALDDIAEAEDCYNGGSYGPCTDDNNTPGDPSDDDTIDLGPYFNNSVIVSGLIPSFNGDDPVGFLPDPYFGGTWIMIDGEDPALLNADEDSDGNADSLQKDIYYVYAGNTGGHPDNVFREDPEAYGYTFLGAASGADLETPFSDGAVYDYYFIKFEPKLNIIDKDVNIDEIQFNDAFNSYCCAFVNEYYGDGWWAFRNPWNPNPNIDVVQFTDGDYMKFSTSAGTTGIRVYGRLPE